MCINVSLVKQRLMVLLKETLERKLVIKFELFCLQLDTKTTESKKKQQNYINKKKFGILALNIFQEEVSGRTLLMFCYERDFPKKKNKLKTFTYLIILKTSTCKFTDLILYKPVKAKRSYQPFITEQ